MGRILVSFVSAFILLFASGCVKEGTVYNAPIESVYEKLADLDLGRGHESAVFRYNEDSPPTDAKPNESVQWFMGKNGKGTTVIAHLTAEGSDKTRVFIEVQTPDMGQMAMFKGFASNMIRERIASHLEERPYNDQKFVDAMYGGNAALVPEEMREAGTAALKMEADMQRDIKEIEASSSGASQDSSSVSRSDVRNAAPMVDTSKYR